MPHGKLNRFQSVLVTLTVCTSCILASAQYDPNAGIPPFSATVGGEYESIDLVTSGIILNIPIRSKAGKGQFNYALVGNSHAYTWRNINNHNLPTWGVSAGSFSQFDLTGVPTSPILLGAYLRFDQTLITCGSDANDGEYFNFAIVDSTGTTHALGLTLDDDGCHAKNASGAVTDGSGLSYVINGGPSFTYTLYDRAGNHTPSVIWNAQPASSVDPDSVASKVSSVYSNGGYTLTNTYTDTLNITPMTAVINYDPTSGWRDGDTYTYIGGDGINHSVTVTYTKLHQKTNFGCTGIVDVENSGMWFPTTVNLADGVSKFTISYEATPGYAGDITGRVSKITLPTGGYIQYGYSGGNNGVNCNSLVVPTLTRTVNDGVTSQQWKYVNSNNSRTPANYAVTVTGPTATGSNQTVYNFSGQFQTQVAYYQGSATGNPLKISQTCYNTNLTSCATPSAVPQVPISQTNVYTNYNSSAAISGTRVNTFYDAYGNVTETDSYDFGATTLLSKVQTPVGTWSSTQSKCVGVGNNVNDTVCYHNVYDSTIRVSEVFSYNAGGHLTSHSISPSANIGNPGNLTNSFTYNTNGTVQSAVDVNDVQGNATTSYAYNGTGGCNSVLPTSVGEPLSLSNSMTWDCNGAAPKSATDENTATVTWDSYDRVWRLLSFTDASRANPVQYAYNDSGSWWTSQYQSFTSGGTSSITGSGTGFDGLGRPIVTNHEQAPGSTNYDTYPVVYDADGHVSTSYMPCVTGAWTCSTPATTQTYDAIGRPLVTTDAGTGSVKNVYLGQDVLVTIGPAPTLENTKQRQYEYDGLGRLISMCEMTTASGSTTCGQNTNQQGFWTRYQYDGASRLIGVCQNTTVAKGADCVQNPSAGQQTRKYGYDGLGRMTSEQNPESGVQTYKYDSDSACNVVGLSPTSNGDLISMTDANANKTCYTYDALHRVTDIVVLKSGACYPPVKRFRYDSSANGVLPIPSGYAANNVSARMVEAWTGDCVWPTPSSGADSATDEWFSYSARGERTDLWESTSHIPGYYHGTAGYAPNGALTVLGGVPGYTSLTYGLDGEGRPNTASQGAIRLVTGVSYNPASQAQNIYLGAGDSDNYGYDPNTGQIKNYTFTVGATPVSQVGNLTWNANGTLRTLAITDGFHSGGTQTCNFGSSTAAGYDDLGRLLSADCGSLWKQTFGYDQYGNVSKSGNLQWLPGYDPATNHALAPITYDANGNLTYDTINRYAWYVDNKLASRNSTTCNIFGSSDGTCILYDAFGREVEQGINGVYKEVMYTPAGKAAIMNGLTTTVKAYSPLPGGATYNQTGTTDGTGYFWHKDWLGTVRLSSSVGGRTAYFDRAFAPFGEMYDNFGNTGDPNFTGDTQDSFANGGLYDTFTRELISGESRWMSPDPSGLAAVNLKNPQSLNRYAYVNNDPLSAIDPSGMACYFVGSGDCTVFLRNAALSIFTGEDAPYAEPLSLGSLWSDVLGLPSGVNCPHVGGLSDFICGGVSPTFDAENGSASCLAGAGPLAVGQSRCGQQRKLPCTADDMAGAVQHAQNTFGSKFVSAWGWGTMTPVILGCRLGWPGCVAGVDAAILGQPLIMTGAAIKGSYSAYSEASTDPTHIATRCGGVRQ